MFGYASVTRLGTQTVSLRGATCLNMEQALPWSSGACRDPGCHRGKEGMGDRLIFQVADDRIDEFHPSKASKKKSHYTEFFVLSETL